MPKTAKNLTPTITHELTPERTTCVACGKHLRADYTNTRTIATLEGVTRLHLTIRRCRNETCSQVRKPYRPEAEGRFALPRHEYGFDILAHVGRLRYREHRSIPEIHAQLRERKILVSERAVLNLLDRYDELLAVSLTDNTRLKAVLAEQKHVILGIDGLQPDVGHEVLWVVRDCLSGEILSAKTMLSATTKDLSTWLTAVKTACPVPIVGIVSDGQQSIRGAVQATFPDVPYQLCQFHYLREAARPIYEADRHAKKELKKKVRGVRVIERSVEGRTDAEAEVIRKYCSAVRSALTDDGRAPLDSSGLLLQERLSAIDASLERASQKGGSRRSCNG
jgi:Transposase, Mutator family